MLRSSLIVPVALSVTSAFIVSFLTAYHFSRNHDTRITQIASAVVSNASQALVKDAIHAIRSSIPEDSTPQEAASTDDSPPRRAWFINQLQEIDHLVQNRPFWYSRQPKTGSTVLCMYLRNLTQTSHYLRPCTPTAACEDPTSAYAKPYAVLYCHLRGMLAAENQNCSRQPLRIYSYRDPDARFKSHCMQEAVGCNDDAVAIKEGSEAYDKFMRCCRSGRFNKYTRTHDFGFDPVAAGITAQEYAERILSFYDVIVKDEVIMNGTEVRVNKKEAGFECTLGEERKYHRQVYDILENTRLRQRKSLKAQEGKFSAWTKRYKPATSIETASKKKEN